MGSMLGRRMGLPVYLENDASAAALAEAWKGGGVGVNNFVTMTLGTGLGVGVIANGDLVRSGRGLHPEVGHVYLRAGIGLLPVAVVTLVVLKPFFQERILPDVGR